MNYHHRPWVVLLILLGPGGISAVTEAGAPNWWVAGAGLGFYALLTLRFLVWPRRRFNMTWDHPDGAAQLHPLERLTYSLPEIRVIAPHIDTGWRRVDDRTWRDGQSKQTARFRPLVCPAPMWGQALPDGDYQVRWRMRLESDRHPSVVARGVFVKTGNDLRLRRRRSAHA